MKLPFSSFGSRFSELINDSVTRWQMERLSLAASVAALPDGVQRVDFAHLGVCAV